MMSIIEFLFGEWKCTDTCSIGANGLLMVFRHSVTGRQKASADFGAGIRHDVEMANARSIMDKYARRYEGWS